jgi:uncharacterized protein YlzI (FlbEa/FlbD family)
MPFITVTRPPPRHQSGEPKPVLLNADHIEMLFPDLGGTTIVTTSGARLEVREDLQAVINKLANASIRVWTD